MTPTDDHAMQVSTTPGSWVMRPETSSASAGARQVGMFVPGARTDGGADRQHTDDYVRWQHKECFANIACLDTFLPASDSISPFIGGGLHVLQVMLRIGKQQNGAQKTMICWTRSKRGSMATTCCHIAQEMLQLLPQLLLQQLAAAGGEVCRRCINTGHAVFWQRQVGTSNIHYKAAVRLVNAAGEMAGQ